LIVSGLVGSADFHTTRAEYAQGSPNQSHISPSILVYEDLTSLTSLVGPGSVYRDGGKDCFKAPASMLRRVRTGPLLDFEVFVSSSSLLLSGLELSDTKVSEP